MLVFENNRESCLSIIVVYISARHWGLDWKLSRFILFPFSRRISKNRCSNYKLYGLFLSLVFYVISQFSE